MIRFLLLLLALVARQVQGQGCPICGPPGQAWFSPNGPNADLEVQGPPDTLTCTDLYEIFELQTRNYRIGEYSCTWAKWTATSRCDCNGNLWDWPDVIENDICDTCGGVLDSSREYQPTSFLGQTCSAIIIGGFGRVWDTQQCSQAKGVMESECGCGSSAPPPPAPDTPAPTPPPTPVATTGFQATCRAEGEECQDDLTSCCGDCIGDRTNPGSGLRFCGPVSSFFDDSRSGYGSGSGRGGENGGSSYGGAGGGGRNLLRKS